MLSINQLSLTYKNGVKALEGISLEISNGMFGLLGPNGAGKSSLMKTIVGLQSPSRGSIVFNGVDVIKNKHYLSKQLGFLPQDFGVYPKASAYELLQHLAILKGISDVRLRKAQILDLLERVNLTPFKDKEVHTFSGGMKQRFGVAQALLGQPKLIIVDEPTAGLDPAERNRFNLLLSEISAEVIVILSTHLVEDVYNLCSQLAIIQEGRILASGNPRSMTKVLEGKIWTKAIEHSALSEYVAKYTILSQQLIERVLHIAVYAAEQPEGFESFSPTLEQVYFQTLHQ